MTFSTLLIRLWYYNLNIQGTHSPERLLFKVLTHLVRDRFTLVGKRTRNCENTYLLRSSDARDSRFGEY